MQRSPMTDVGPPPVGTVLVTAVSFDGDGPRVTAVFDSPVDGSLLPVGWLANTTVPDATTAFETQVDPSTAVFTVTGTWTSGDAWAVVGSPFPVAPLQTGLVL